jgi:putative hydrolase
MPVIDNQAIARRLNEAADLLEQQGANPFRVRAYRRAAGTVGALDTELGEIAAARGCEALEDLPDVGTGIASAIREMLLTGQWSQLERLRGEVDPEQLFATVPGLGPELARRVHDALGIDTLEALEAAAYDGRLGSVEGIGPRRLKSVRAALNAQLGRDRRPRAPRGEQPGVELLLEVDGQYRAQAAAGQLRRIAPRRFNPEGDAWLPIMHLERGGWHFTALYSNTARAHELGRTRDWVVIYFYDRDHVEGQCTVVTEYSGRLEGLRVVRGRERECMEHYRRALERQAG